MTSLRLLVFAGLGLCGLLFAGGAAAGAPAHCPQRVDLRDLMTVTEFDQAGLDKLDTQQLAALNAWLSRYLHSLCTQAGAKPAAALPAPAPGAAVTPGKKRQPVQTPASTPTRGQTTTPSPTSAEMEAFGSPPRKVKEPGEIASRIAGEFHGWTGDTVFRLENGQVWKQAGPGYFQVDMKNPKVTIKKLLIGYVLLVEGYAKEVFVRRIQ